MKQIYFIMSLLISANLLANKISDDVRWMYEVVIGSEFVKSKNIVRLWDKSPTASILDIINETERRHFEEAIQQINEVLQYTKIKKIELLDTPTSNADIHIYYKNAVDFPKIAKQYDFEYIKGNLGFFCTFSNAKGVINKAVILISKDKLDEEELKHVILEETIQALGLSNDSEVYEESIFYSGWNTNTELTDRDKFLITFAYAYFSPGMTPRQMQKAMAKFNARVSKK